MKDLLKIELGIAEILPVFIKDYVLLGYQPLSFRQIEKGPTECKVVIGSTNYSEGAHVIEISSNNGVNCENGGTPIDKYTSNPICICPGGLYGKNCNHALYLSFDTPDGIAFMAGTEQSNNDLLVPGWIYSAVSTNRSQNQWIDLGYHLDVCLTHRYGCGEAGALSMWLRLIDCPRRGGIITTRAGRNVNPTGFNIACINPLRLQYDLLLSSGQFKSVAMEATTANRWHHIVFNFIGSGDGQGFIVYQNGQMVQNATTRHPGRLPALDKKIVIGRLYTNESDRYSSVDVDELVLTDRALSEPEIKRLNL